MEEWNILVRNISDHYENTRLLTDCAETIFRKLSKRIKDIKKFEQRLGIEYEQLIEELKFPETMVQDLLKNDDFFYLTLVLTKIYRN
jgi:hypothetical protein